MSISGRQFYLALEQAINCNSNGVTGPTATFNATPDLYTLLDTPTNVTTSGTITLNDAVIVSWVIKEDGVTVATGVTLSPSFVQSTPPTTTTVYTLEVNYTLNGTPGLLTLNDTVIVSEGALYGDLGDPVTDITVESDLTSVIENTLTAANQATISGLFPLTISGSTARVIFVIPYSFGTSWSILDNDNFSVDSEFTFIDDPGDNRRIAVSNNPFIPGTYMFQIDFS